MILTHRFKDMFSTKNFIHCHWLMCFLWVWHTDFCASQGDHLAMTQHRYACDSPESCRTNIYSIECSVAEKIAMVGVSYGAKPYTPICPRTQACLSKSRCCGYEPGDCMVPMNDSELVKIYKDCSHNVQCGWLFASSTELTGPCKAIRDRSNYIKVDFQCINDHSFIDICSQHTVTAKSVHIHHSAIPPSVYDNNYCQCSISPDVCNTTATLKFRAVDVRLHQYDNLSLCDVNSRIELIGQREKKLYSCEPEKFLYGFQKFHISSENNMMLYLQKKPREYPTKVWLEVQASLSDVNVKVTCGPRSVETAPRCPALPFSKSETLDTVEDVPERTGNQPTIIHLDPADLDPDLIGPDEKEPSEKQNPAMAAVIGGIVAGVVVLVLLLIVVCLIIRKKKKNKERKALPSAKECYPYAEESHQNNFYEPISDKAPMTSSDGGKNIVYHQPWGHQPGVSVQSRAKPPDLAYATSEEIKVLIEKMEKDRRSIIDGNEDHYSEPDPTYYRHISTFTFKPHGSDLHGRNDDDEPDEADDANGKESETESVASDNCGTEKLESEDSKVEADRGIDSDVESHKVESEIVSAYYDGYESPRVSSFNPSDATESVRTSVRSSTRSDNPSELQNYVYQPDDVILEDSQSDLDVPDEHAPPVSVALGSQSKEGKTSNNLDKGKTVTLGSYREPKGSKEILFADSDSDNEAQSSHPYSPVYDEIKENNTKL